MKVSIRRISSESAPDLEPMYLRYVSEMAKNADSAASENSARHIQALSKYWQAESHWPYWICAGGKVAGFCLARRYPSEPCTNDIEQFFVTNEYKRKGVGTEALRQILELHPGDWLVRVLKTNEKGLLFWRRAIECCGFDYKIRDERDLDLVMNFIRFRVENL